MQRDKATLDYGGRSQLERAMALLAPLVSRAYVSVRAEQQSEPLRARFLQIVDAPGAAGPIAGLLAAQARHPDVAWLVLACDLPLLDTPTLTHLLRARAPQRMATAYRSSRDGLPEPLCAIYEPRSATALSAYVASGRDCPRKFLRGADTELLDQPDPHALDNVNTPEEYGAVMSAMRPPAGDDLRRLTVQYYAVLREQAGRREESLTTAARTPRELYDELRSRHPFSLAPEMLRVAVNTEFRDWSTPLSDGDRVVFIPPVAGG
ncbi:MAG: NTP transferase domain-containing protein [Gammaproteobacteria bacterium]|nr:NTP transferase domain-containing protein [Gammaproteobacteria bacterium]